MGPKDIERPVSLYPAVFAEKEIIVTTNKGCLGLLPGVLTLANWLKEWEEVSPDVAYTAQTKEEAKKQARAWVAEAPAGVRRRVIFDAPDPYSFF